MATDWFTASAELSGYAEATESTTWEEEVNRTTTIHV